MDVFINIQLDVLKRLSKAQVNFKKSPKERITESYVETRLSSFEALYQEFANGHKLLIKEANWKELQTNSYTKEDIYNQAEELYIDHKTELKSVLLCLQAKSKAKSVDCVSGESGASHGYGSSVKLPKITIPTFSGKYTEWVSFRDMFTSLVDSNRDLGDVEKLHYLKSHLTGEAEQLIRQIPVTADNYKKCWDLLESRYNNKKYLSNCILKRLFSQKNSNVETASALRELLDTTSDCLHALANLGIDVSTWDIIVIHIVSYKLDLETRKQWELKVSSESSNDLPTFKQFSDFLHSRFRALEFIEPRVRPSGPVNNSKVMHVTSNILCEYCAENHKLYMCKKFSKEDYKTRHDFIAKNSLCFNCFGSGHSVKVCTSTLSCRVCKRKHHSLLHPKSSGDTNGVGKNSGSTSLSGDGVGNSVASKSATSSSTVGVTPVVSCFGRSSTQSQILLATAIVKAKARDGVHRYIRALLDQGSQASFVTEATVQYLRSRKIPGGGVISGLDGSTDIKAPKKVEFTIYSRFDPSVSITVQAYVLKSITTLLPSRTVTDLEWLDDIKLFLADPSYHTPNKIDILLGGEVYGKILQDGIRRGPRNSPVAQATSFGWILSGEVQQVPYHGSAAHVVAMHVRADSNEDEQLKKFWELEAETKPEKLFNCEEKLCEELFKKTTKRDQNGRYIVKLPFKSGDLGCIHGSSRYIAEKRLTSLWLRLSKDVELKQRYTEVIQEYIMLGHMEEVPASEKYEAESVYLPHHAVIRNDKDTSKVRVVFNASCKYKNGVSLNDCLMIGPTLQPELRHLLMRWRRYEICLVADIVKMYRQVKVTDKDSNYQRVLWKDDVDGRVKDYRLLRVTFGTASAPYLAVKALQQVALDEADCFPAVSKRVRKDFYMDDLLTGCSTVEEGMVIYEQMNAMLQKGGFELQKWMTNSKELLTKIKETRQGKEGNEESLKLKLDEIVKLVGLTWNREADVFQYAVSSVTNIELDSVPKSLTKRKIISYITKLYDPLGWVAPSVIVAKIIIQKLWIAGISWDEIVPEKLLKEWQTYSAELPLLSQVRVPRWLGTRENNKHVELHGFADASKAAFAAVVYLRVVDYNNKVHVSLVTAKTKVAPIKQVSIPRLELCGAVLVTRLLVEVAKVLEVDMANIRAWTDSTVVLAWLNSHPNRWQTFVANRVSEILTTLEFRQWSHVPSSSNPADCASRGINPSELVSNSLWFEGPEFLRYPVVSQGKPVIEDVVEEARVHFTSETETFIWERFSSLTKLVRVLAYCQRFISNAKISGHVNRCRGFLTAKEMREALHICIRQCQQESFREELALLKRDGSGVKLKGALKALNPFIDGDGLLRVGGRLEKSQLSATQKHPILLPKTCNLSKLIVCDVHLKSLHGGIQLMLSYLCSKYFILGAKNLVKSCVRKCVKCVRYNSLKSTQLMGQLPEARVTPGRAFKCSGVDYAGPISVRTTKGRGYRAYKGYIALFVCMATRAVHIEVVSDLSSQGFLAAFRRFVARRGMCTDVWSDNGTNFVGASRELQSLFTSERSGFVQEIAESLATNGTTWHFIPPHSPNFGGLWEAGVKSVKHHLRRVIGDTTLTYEELSTVLAQIEACLNSRPLSRLDSESDAINVLTPGHFLVGEPLVGLPDYNYESSNINSLSRWQLTQRMVQGFWRRWSQEYLTKFLHRYRWSYITPEPKIGDVMLVKEDDLPPSRWLLGRVLEKHTGSDNVTRVVTLKTKNSVIKRPVSKLCVLPTTN